MRAKGFQKGRIQKQKGSKGNGQPRAVDVNPTLHSRPARPHSHALPRSPVEALIHVGRKFVGDRRRAGGVGPAASAGFCAKVSPNIPGDPSGCRLRSTLMRSAKRVAFGASHGPWRVASKRGNQPIETDELNSVRAAFYAILNGYVVLHGSLFGRGMPDSGLVRR